MKTIVNGDDDKWPQVLFPMDYEVFGLVSVYDEKKDKWVETNTTVREQVDSTNNRAKILINTEMKEIGFAELSIFYDGKAGKIYTKIPKIEYCKVEEAKDLNITDYNLKLHDPKANITSY